MDVTNRNIWPEYGATAPIWAHVYDDTLMFAKNNAATVSLQGSVQPKLEPEIALRGFKRRDWINAAID